MKAAIFHGPNQPLTIEQVDIDDPRDHEVLVRTAATRRMPQRPAFRGGLLSVSRARDSRSRGGRRGREGRQGGYLSQAGRPRDLVPVGLLRVLRGVHVRQSPPLLESPRDAAAQGRHAAAVAGRQDGAAVLGPFDLCREDAGARERAGEDHQGDSARPRGADRLRRDHRGRRGAQYREDRAGLDGGGLRLRRRRHLGDPGRASWRARGRSSRSISSRTSSRWRSASARPTRSTRRTATRSRRSTR